MERILIIGCPGAGKSALARCLGERLTLPVIHLDALWWRPGWVESERPAFDRRLAEVTAGERWIIDGNYTRTLKVRLQRADTVIWLDPPRRVCLWRVYMRALRWRGRTRPDLANGCPERLPDRAFLRFIWQFPRQTSLRLRAAIAEHGAHARLLHFRRDAELAAFLRQRFG